MISNSTKVAIAGKFAESIVEAAVVNGGNARDAVDIVRVAAAAILVTAVKPYLDDQVCSAFAQQLRAFVRSLRTAKGHV
jgi:hypothetical protein